MSATQNDFASRDDWRADYRVVPEMPAPLAPSSRAKSRDPAEVSLKITQRDPSTSVRDDDYFKSLSARAAWLQLGQIFPSSDYLDRVDARAPCESPFLRPRRPPIQSSPDQRKSLRHPAQDYKNRSRPARHSGWRTRPCS